MKMRQRRPVLLLTALGTLIPSLAAATATPPHDLRLLADDNGGIPASALALAVVIVLGVAAMLVTGRLRWPLGMMVLIGCGALLGGGAISDGLQTAMAVSP